MGVSGSAGAFVVGKSLQNVSEAFQTPLHHDAAIGIVGEVRGRILARWRRSDSLVLCSHGLILRGAFAIALAIAKAPQDEGGRDARLPATSSHSRLGLSGISRSSMPVPDSASASSMAWANNDPTGMAPASPAPLMPSGLSGDTVTVWSSSMRGTSTAVGSR